jgi:hypothetical protein
MDTASVVFPGVKRPGREADRSPPSSAEVKNGGSMPPLPHTPSWRGVLLIKHRDNFTCPFYVSTALLNKMQVNGLVLK